MKFQKDSQTLDDADFQELLHSHAAKLTEEDRQQLTVLNEPTHENNYNPVVHTPQLTIIILKKGLEMVDDVVKHLFKLTISKIGG